MVFSHGSTSVDPYTEHATPIHPSMFADDFAYIDDQGENPPDLFALEEFSVHVRDLDPEEPEDPSFDLDGYAKEATSQIDLPRFSSQTPPRLNR
jgi:hypothetical protein